MTPGEAMRKLHEKDHFAEAVHETFTARGGWASRPSRQPGRRGPAKQFTESVDASVTEDVARKLQKVATRRGISRAGLVRQIFTEWLQANEQAWR